MKAVSSWLIDPLGPGPDWVTFILINGDKVLFQTPSVTYAQLALLAVDKLVTMPGGMYTVSQFIPTFAVLSLSPDNGPAAGGTAITVNGVGFVDGCTVNMGGQVVTATFVSPTQLAIISASNTAGTVGSLIIRNPDGSEAPTGTNWTWT